MKKEITLSINPSYYCNLRCEFCYLTEQQLGDKTRLRLERLNEILNEVSQHYTIKMVDLYGGEPLMLPRDYLMKLKWLLFSKGIHDINVVTNLTVDSPFLNDPDLYITVSYDFDSRERYEEVFERMLFLENPFSILMLAEPKLLFRDTTSIIKQFNLLAKLDSLEIKPYSTNQSNTLPVKDKDFERLVQRFIDDPTDKKFQFINEDNIESSLRGERNAFSNDHLYITPNGSLAVLEFDEDDKEFFLELPDIQAYWAWCEKEERRVRENEFCSKCEYLGTCLTEHFREVRSLEEGCNGFKGLLDRYK